MVVGLLRALATYLKCLEVGVEAAVAARALKKENLWCILSKQLLKICIMERPRKLLSIGREYVANVKVKEEKQELSKNVVDARAEAWKYLCRCLAQECILKDKDHVMIAMDRVKLLVKKTSARHVTERKSSKRKRSLKHR
jgi:hypothetical protein